jgi:L-seryl-tRNA(Ser) seleniumtransferase
MVLRVHASNFTIAGFTESPDPAELAALAHEAGAIVVDDLGSGALLATEAFDLAHEPMPSERLAAGADLVTFSGDKLVGGPQAGLVVGRADLIARMRRDPLARAMRPDKATLTGVAATLGLYRAGRAAETVPVWQMIAMPPLSIRARATAVVAALEGRVAADVLAVDSTIGGGSLPGETLPSFAVAIRARSAGRFLRALRLGDPPVIGRVAEDQVILDLRTVDPGDDERLVAAVARALDGAP